MVSENNFLQVFTLLPDGPVLVDFDFFIIFFEDGVVNFIFNFKEKIVRVARIKHFV
jgi:hypothetical protein